MNDIRAVLMAGLTWLYHTVQPPDAIMQHHGVFQRLGGRLYSFTPAGARSMPVVAVSLARPRRTADGELLNPLDQAEVAAIAAEITALGYGDTDRWNGAGHETGSFGLARPAHPSLVAAVDRYRAGCPDHPERGVFCKCGWFAAGHDRLILPDWDGDRL